MEHKPDTYLEIPTDLQPFIFTDEHIITIQPVASSVAQAAPSGLKELYRLARAKIGNELQTLNPTLASLALETEHVNASPELHRYEALFGRDALRVAIDVLPIYPQLTRATIVAFAELQGVTSETSREEEPGRIPHEVRNPSDTTAMKLTEERGWGWPYYGSIDATPEFIRTLAGYCNETKEGTAILFQHYVDRNGHDQIIADSLDRSVQWLLARMNRNPEGLLESKTVLPRGIENQVWKDSWDSYFHKDGTIANHTQGVASVEVQRVVYDALLDAADLYAHALGRTSHAAELRGKAENLRQTIFREFWTEEDGGYFVIGTDRNKSGNLRQMKIRTSNMGHLLYSRLLEGDDPRVVSYREAIVTQLFSPELLARFGIRTLASDSVRYRPGSYHNGSVWLWDTYFVAKGLRRHGYEHLAHNLSERLFEIIDNTNTFPEFVRGDSQDTPRLNTRIVDVWDEVNQRTNRIEQPPQAVQAWSVAAILALQHYDHMNGQRAMKPMSAFESRIFKSLPK